MTNPMIGKDALMRAPRALALSLLWGGLAACVVSACVYDVGRWIDAW